MRRTDTDNKRSQMQRDINNLKSDPLVVDTIRGIAERDHEGYPQYFEHWDGWFLVRITKMSKTKFGVMFLPGDITICKSLDPNEYGAVTCYSIRVGIDHSLSLDKVCKL